MIAVVAGGYLLTACNPLASSPGPTPTQPQPCLLAANSAGRQPCRGGFIRAAGTPGGQLVFSDSQPLPDLNVIGNPSETTQEVTRGPLWASLWVFRGDGRPYADLVSEVPTTTNGDVIKRDSTHMDVTIKLRKGLAWSDGTPLTTKDLAFTISAICDPASGALTRAGYDHIASIEIKSAEVMVWHFGPNKKGACGLSADLGSGIYAPYLTMNLLPLPEEVLGRVPHKDWSNSAYFRSKPTVTSGPYMVQRFTPGASAVLTMLPNPHYADGRTGELPLSNKPYLDRLTFRSYPDKAAEIAGVRTGQTDLALGLSAADLPALQHWSEGIAVYATGLRDEFLNLNLGENTTGCAGQGFVAGCGTPTPWQDDAILRQAITLAIDKDAVNRQLFAGIGKTMNSVFPSGLAPYYDTSTPYFHRDVVRANTILDQDGWVKDAGGIRVKSGRQLAWSLSVIAGDSQRMEEASILSSYWRDIGAAVTVKSIPPNLFDADFSGGGVQATGQFDMALETRLWSPDPDAWAATILPSEIPSVQNQDGQNWDRVSDPTLTSLFMQGANEVDIARRVDLYRKAQAEWLRFKPTIELSELPEVFALVGTFGNFLPSVNPCLSTCDAAEWYRKTT